jgi:hypothetical protein
MVTSRALAATNDHTAAGEQPQTTQMKAATDGADDADMFGIVPRNGANRYARA